MYIYICVCVRVCVYIICKCKCIYQYMNIWIYLANYGEICKLVTQNVVKSGNVM